MFLDAIFNSVPGMVYLYDNRNNLVRWNNKHNEMTGFSTKELASMSLLDWYKGDEKSQKAVLEAIEIAMKTGFGDTEADLQIKDGTKIPMYFAACPVKIEGKVYFAGIGMDMTQRNQLNKRLQKYKVLAENANDAMLFVDKEGNINEVNDAAIRMYGYTYEEFLKISIFDLRHVVRDTNVIEQMEKADRFGIIFETIHYLKDGTAIPVEVSSQGTFLGDERILLSIIRNISERKKAEEEISIEARIIAVAETYEDMTADRSYRKALSEEDAIHELRECSGMQFDQNITKVFVEKVLGKRW